MPLRYHSSSIGQELNIHSQPKKWASGSSSRSRYHQLISVWMLSPLPSLAHRLQHNPTKSSLQPLLLPYLSLSRVTQESHFADSLPSLNSIPPELQFPGTTHTSFISLTALKMHLLSLYSCIAYYTVSPKDQRQYVNTFSNPINA